MQAVKNFFGFFKGSKSLSEELSGIKLIGKLNRKLIGKPRQLLSDEVSIELCVVNEKNFEYDLVITNDEYSGDESNNLNKLLDDWKQLSFELNADRSFKLFVEEGHEVLVWEKDRLFYYFHILNDIINTANKEQYFKYLTYLVASNDLEQDIKKLNDDDADAYLTKIKLVRNIDDYLDENYSKFSTYEGKIDYTSDKAINDSLADEFSKKLNVKQLYFQDSYPEAICLSKANGDLNKYFSEEDQMKTISSSAIFQIFKVANFKYFLVVDEAKEKKTYVCTPISFEINIVTDKKENIIMWLDKDSSTISCYNFVLNDNEQIESIRKTISICLYENSKKEEFQSIAEENRQWVEDAYMDSPEDEEMNMFNTQFNDQFDESVTETSNKLTTQAYLHDRTFVIRDDNTIGVYKTDEDDMLTEVANLPVVKDYNNHVIDIKRANMFNSDSSIVFLDENNPNKAFMYDLTKGKVVEEWDAENLKKIETLHPEKKFDQMTNNPLTIGVNSNSLFMMDRRVNKKDKVVEIKNYKTNPKMNTLATTNFGGIAVGSTNGEIRLYKEVGKNAKTLFCGLGGKHLIILDPILSIDVSADGKYLLATCKTYIMIIPTQCKGDTNGFNVPMGKEKPHPRILKIKPNDIVKYGIKNVSFTPARFNLDQITGETNIITSCGEYMIDWNFLKVKKGILDSYQIKKVSQNVLDNQFKYQKNQIVVTMDNRLRIQNQINIDE